MVSSNEIRLPNLRSYEIDFTKVKTLEDVIAILRGLQVNIVLDHPIADNWKPMMPYLKERA